MEARLGEILADLHCFWNKGSKLSVLLRNILR